MSGEQNGGSLPEQGFLKSRLQATEVGGGGVLGAADEELLT